MVVEYDTAAKHKTNNITQNVLTQEFAIEAHTIRVWIVL